MKIIYFVATILLCMIAANFLRGFFGSIWRHIQNSRQDNRLYKETQKKFDKLSQQEKDDLEKSVRM